MNYRVLTLVPAKYLERVAMGAQGTEYDVTKGVP